MGFVACFTNFEKSPVIVLRFYRRCSLYKKYKNVENLKACIHAKFRATKKPFISNDGHSRPPGHTGYLYVSKDYNTAKKIETDVFVFIVSVVDNINTPILFRLLWKIRTLYARLNNIVGGFRLFRI